MIVDCHTHAWEHWPYEPAVPDAASRGRAEQLLWEMDRHQVDKAVLVCARIEHNPHNNDYAYTCVQQHPDRLLMFADVDCSWTQTYHTPGAAGRLEAAAKQYQLRGYTHYLRDDVAWFSSPEGLAFFEKTAELGLIASLSLGPAWQPALRQLARQFPSVVFLCHHMAGVRVGQGAADAGLEEVLRSAEVPNIHIKLSGFHYVSEVAWEYPYGDAMGLARERYQHYGPQRLCWGSDYPVVRFYQTYQQSLEVVRRHCSFIPESDLALILGGNMERLLGQ